MNFKKTLDSLKFENEQLKQDLIKDKEVINFILINLLYN